ncbi:MAG: DnaJ domain-containing protein [Bacteroidota bacterium]
MNNDFQILGISDSVSIAEIKKAYRLKAKEFHPDVNKSPDAAAQFRIISEAYHRLIDFKEGRYNYQQPAIDYEVILREKARAQARMRYQEWKKNLDEEERKTPIDKIYWGKQTTIVLAFITVLFLTDQLLPSRIKIEKIKQTEIATDDQLYYNIETEDRKILLASDREINGLEKDNLIMVGETPLFHSMKEVTTLQNIKYHPDNTVGNYNPALIINLLLLLITLYFPLKTYQQKLWIKTLVIICSLYYLVSFLQSQR